MVAGQPAADRLMRQLDNRITGEPKPTHKQVAMVLHALADHTAIMQALRHRPDPTSPWPEANSVGRWLHDVGDDLEDLLAPPADGTDEPSARLSFFADLSAQQQAEFAGWVAGLAEEVKKSVRIIDREALLKCLSDQWNHEAALEVENYYDKEAK